MPFRKSNILGVISFNRKHLHRMMVSHPEKPGSFIVDKPESKFVRDHVTELVSALIGIPIDGNEWSMRIAGNYKS